MLSVTGMGNAYYLGIPVKTNIEDVKGVLKSLKAKGVSKRERKEIIRHVL